MPVNAELLEILACPETKQPLVLASQEVIDGLNARIGEVGLRNRGGEAITTALQEGLVREDGKVLYPVSDGIPVMLIEESIQLD